MSNYFLLKAYSVRHITQVILNFAALLVQGTRKQQPREGKQLAQGHTAELELSPVPSILPYKLSY